MPVAILMVVVCWLALVLFVDAVRFVVLDPQTKTGFEVFLAFGQLFGAFVLALSPVEATADRMRWVASGFCALAVGALGFGYLYPLVSDAPHLNAMMYGSLYVRTGGTLLIAVGLLPVMVPRIPRGLALGLLGLVILIGIGIVAAAEALPPLVRATGTATIIGHDPGSDTETLVPHAHLADVEQLVSDAHAIFPGLTGWHWGLSLLPLTAGVAAVWGIVRHASRFDPSTWLLIAVSLLAGAHLHSVFWPSMYSSILTTTSVLRLGVAIVVVIGGVLELRRVVDERAALLAEEQERVRRLEDLAALKADFTAIVAHELATPLAAISTLAEMLATGALTTEQSRQIGQTIQAEVRLLQLLVRDVRISAEIEQGDFRIQPRRVAIASLLAEADAYTHTLPQTHPVSMRIETTTHVLADPARIGQVLRNLITNATRYTPSGTPITICATPSDDEVVIAVADRGPGISEQEQVRIFEKFARGTEATHHAGYGLGLYLSRRILQAHGSDLVVDSSPGAGAMFQFTLKEVP